MSEHTRAWIDGKAFSAPGGSTFENRSPVDGTLVSVVDEASHEVVDEAVTRARAALRGPWGKLSTPERARLLFKVADGIDAGRAELVAAEVGDTGKPVALASHLDVPRAAANFRAFAEMIAGVPAESFVMKTPDGGDAVNYSIRVPKGIVAVICPWNLPLLLMTWKVAPALACGNTVVVKPSEETPRTAALLGEIMRDAGVPDGVYNVVHGFGPGSAGEDLTTHPGVDAITFTGETRTGTAIMKAASVGVRAVSFELGGKNPGLVFADCDFDRAVHESARAVFLNAGQVCLGTERIYVERPIFDRFVEALRAKAEALVPGRPESERTTLGPLISRAHREKVLSYYERARAEGAKVVTGGHACDMPGELAAGAFVEPTLWTGLPESSAVVREEIFGPCAHLAPFDDEDEVVARANDTPYGLAATLFTRDLSRAHRVAPRLDVGIVWVNSWFLRDLRTPFGGTKHSGIGREGGVHSLEFYTELRNVCIKL
jgi:aminomuconate-semialdehyde/2-hydroxymuconate-6-semialdehyde dehydrogenase